MDKAIITHSIKNTQEENVMNDLFDLKGKVAVVTGANTGLGQGMCKALASAGADIAGVARRDCSETKALVEKEGVKFLEVIADLSSTEPCERILKEVLDAYGHVDILVNNAGIIKREDAIDFSLESWDSVINVNLRTVFYLSQVFARQFVKQGNGGKIISTASMLSYQGGIRVPAYTASKSAILGLTRALANEWAKYDINVNGIAPGYMATNNTAQLRDDEKRSEEILGRIPAGRWGTPDDMAGAVIFLASKASDYVNGFTIAVDGGWLAR
ncbi:MAG: 2-dehydro-3-deoxy-D-gluconate 5-dehydrogenase KduD [Lachnospiraceae bacterium]|nr:2-dehydro-3-deoxy-D-gluconate 5-dehydrogenase KduD [Lachnospiraceae bacterium]